MAARVRKDADPVAVGEVWSAEMDEADDRPAQPQLGFQTERVAGHAWHLHDVVDGRTDVQRVAGCAVVVGHGQVAGTAAEGSHVGR